MGIVSGGLTRSATQGPFSACAVKRLSSAGNATLSRLPARRTTSGRLWKEKSLYRHTRTSLNRLLSQAIASCARDNPGLALTKASATSSGLIVAG
jgi:hypothetical protein